MKKILVIAAGVMSMTMNAGNSFPVVHGTVKADGKGLPGVVVSDGYSCTVTDRNGRYSLEASRDGRFIYVSTPSGYLPPVEEGTVPVFYKTLDPKVTTYDFDLVRNPRDDNRHTVFVQADVQMTDPAQLEGYADVLADINAYKAGNGNDVFGIDCGDIVGDTPSLFPGYIKTASMLDMPVYRVIGNHDMDYWGRSFETSYRTFENYFGPNCYSFNRGKAHYIVINNNFYIGRDYFYIGYVTEQTFRWLEQDLSYVPEGSLVIVSAHMPMRPVAEQQPFAYDYDNVADQTVNASAFLAMFSKFDTHLFTGHMHYNLNVCYNDRLMEHNTAAVCGTWWCLDICLDGTPVGYGVYDVDGAEMRWLYKSAGYPVSYQGRAYSPGKSPDFPEALVANVWNYDDDWKVEWLENGVVMGEMEKFTGFDPQAYVLCQDKTKIKYDWISPTRTRHLFKAVPSTPDASLSVRATDRFGNVYDIPVE